MFTVALLLGAGAGGATGAESAGELGRRLVVLLRMRLVCILLRAGRGVGYGVGLGVAERRALEKEEPVRRVDVAVVGAAVGSSAVSAVSVCSPGSG